MKLNLFHIAIILIPFFGASQKLSSKLSQKQITIGQPITLTYTVELEKEDTLLFEPKSEKIEGRAITGSNSISTEGISFEIREDFRDTFIIESSSKKWIGEYIITAWDSGMYLIPGPKVAINDSMHYFGDVAIGCYLIDPIKGVDLYDIKENYTELPDRPFDLIKFLTNNWWWLSILLLIIVIYLIYKLRKSREDEDDEVQSISLRERTIIAIDALEAAKLWEKNDLKKHFTELSFILRSYLTARYKITLLEMTTYQSRTVLREKGLNEDTIEVIIRILNQSDMVKFAKSKPDVIAILKISTLAKQVVAETSPLDFDNVE